MRTTTTTAPTFADGRVRMDDIQRARLLAAMSNVVAERGLADATVARVVAGAGVSRRTFYELFEDREQCFLAALDDAIERAAEQVLPAYRSGRTWLEQIREGLAALLGFLDSEPRVGRLLIVGSLAAGPRAIERRERVLGEIAGVVDEGRSESKAADAASPLSAEGVVGGALSILHTRIVAGERPLTRLYGALMSTIVMPYLGPAAARRELGCPPPEPQRPASRAEGDALRKLGTRLTYRTVGVLVHLAEHPGSSNRRVGDAAGISDQGQVSKLLWRLQRLGLVENVGGPRARGEANAWRLTAKGRDIERAVDVTPPLSSS